MTEEPVVPSEEEAEAKLLEVLARSNEVLMREEDRRELSSLLRRTGGGRRRGSNKKDETESQRRQTAAVFSRLDRLAQLGRLSPDLKKLLREIPH